MSETHQGRLENASPREGDARMTLGEMWVAICDNARLLVMAPLMAGLLGVAITMLISPTFTATTTFMPPQQSQSNAASALASLGSLASLAGGVAGIGSPGERYVSLLQSVTVSDRIIAQFKLLDVYEVKFKVEGRLELATKVRIMLGKKDGLITIEVDDKEPQRAADIANQYVKELRHITGILVVTEAQQRRAFFQQQLQQSRDRLALAQQALQASGFNAGALKAEPKAAAEAYARLKAETTAAEMRLQILRGGLADTALEVRQQQTTLAALREQLARTEQATDNAANTDYIGKYREFKYQETLFELYARQFELARVDESREGALIQVVDPATPPEKKSKPKRAVISLGAALIAALLLAPWVILRQTRRRRLTGTIPTYAINN